MSPIIHLMCNVYEEKINEDRQNQFIRLTNIGRMNNIQACAREIVDKEMIYQ